jgi:multiple antibiotic resistance protein
MNTVIRNILLIVAGLLPIVNPLGMAPIFADMTLGYPEKVRRTVALRVAVNGVALLMASMFIGGYILQFFGITLAAVQIGGGLVVTFAGWQILNKKNDLGERVPETPPSSQEILSQAFYPLTMPLTVGPGSIAVALTLGSNLHEERHLELVFSVLTAVIGIVLIGVAVFLCYWFSERLQQFLGPTGTSILIRLSAFLVLCIGIQIMFNGLQDFYSTLKHATG